MDFSNALEMELSSTRLSKPADLHVQDGSAITSGQSQNLPHISDVQLEGIPSYGLSLERTTDLSSDTASHLATGGLPLGNAICKVKTVDTLDNVSGRKYSLSCDVC